jgi:Ca2+-binding RTX toxin-like protein
MRVDDTDDALITLRNQFQLTSTFLFGDYYFDNVDELRFDDGGIWDMATFGRALLAQASTDGDDVIYGFDMRDTLDGGAGNDRLEGGVYSDTYVFAAATVTTSSTTPVGTCSWPRLRHPADAGTSSWTTWSSPAPAKT